MANYTNNKYYVISYSTYDCNGKKIDEENIVYRINKKGKRYCVHGDERIWVMEQLQDAPFSEYVGSWRCKTIELDRTSKLSD